MSRIALSPAALLVMALAAAVTPMISAVPVLAETAIAPEKNPPGDIPDSQAFVVYKGANFVLKVPEGWARSDMAQGVQFESKLDGVSVTLSDRSTAPSLDWAKHVYALDMVAKGRAVEVTKVTDEKLSAGTAIKIAYSLNSEPNPVTTKQIRLEANRYLFWKSGKLAALDLYAPFGADNVDQWQLMSQSFAWH